MAFVWLKRLTGEKRTGTAPAGAALSEVLAKAPELPPPPQAPPTDIPADKIAQRAYEKWVAKGRPAGTAHQDWVEAEAELRAEFAAAKPESLPRHSR